MATFLGVSFPGINSSVEKVVDKGVDNCPNHSNVSIFYRFA